jgi:heme-degrading monooxygenase HmoA
VTVFARSTTMTGKPDVVDAGIAMVRDEVMPAVEAMEGCVGLSMLVDRDSGGTVVTTAWDTEDAMRASEVGVARLRDRAQQLFGSRPEVREWEIAVLHRAHHVPEGACARVTWTRVDPIAVDEQLETFRLGVLPHIEELPGFCSTSLLIDRRTGRSALATVYESRDAMVDSREAAMDLRADSVRRMSMELLDVAEFDVAMAHLRVPERV